MRSFDVVELFARVRASAEQPPEHMIIPPRIRVIRAPYYHGVSAAVFALPRLLLAAWRLTGGRRIFILRGPGTLAIVCAAMLMLRRRSFLVELLGDPGEAFLYANVPLRRVTARVFEIVTRAVVRRARAVLYVVPYLQQRYPAGAGAATVVVTDARLPEEIFRQPVASAERTEFRLVMVGNMEQPYKGHSHLLKAIRLLRDRGVPVRLRLVGDGRLRPEFEQLARDLDVVAAVDFLGAVPWGQPVFDVLDDSDLFIMTSLTEGLPKALLEACARGLPSIATPVGGFPDVLPPEALFAAGDAAAAAEKIESLFGDRVALARLANRCFVTAQNYRASDMMARRAAFYEEAEQRLSADFSEV